MEKEVIFGIEVNTESVTELVQLIDHDILHKRKAVIVSVNPEKIMHAKNNLEFFQKLTQVTYRPVDGIGVGFATKINGGNFLNRVTGIDLFEALIQNASITGKRIGFLGAEPGFAKIASEKLTQKYSGLQTKLIKDGYDAMSDNESLIREINGENLDILFVGLGSPKQEKWIFDNKDKLNVSVIQGVGGALDIFAGKVKRAPKIFRMLGLEWFYRLVIEPNRIKRQLNLFVFLIEAVKRRFSKNDSIKDAFKYEELS